MGDGVAGPYREYILRSPLTSGIPNILLPSHLRLIIAIPNICIQH